MSYSTLTKIYSLPHDSNLNIELTTNVKARCIKFLAKLLSPTEVKHDGSLELEYTSLLYLLQIDDVFSYSENSLHSFITKS